MHFLLAAGAPIASVSARLPEARVTLGDNERELMVTFDRFALSTGSVLNAVLPDGEVLDVSISEPAIEDVVRKVYAGELRLGLGNGKAAT